MTMTLGIRRSILVAVVALGALACRSVPALGLTGHEFSFSFGAFARPNDLAVDQANGNVFVVDVGANVVKVFGANGGGPAGVAPREITGAEAPEGSFDFGDEPAGVAIDNSGGSSNGDTYVSDVLNHVVDKFGPEGRYICQFRSATQDCLKEPVEEPTYGETTGVAVDAQGNVYISDYSGSAVDEYDSAGEPIGQISVIEPAGVAVDSHGTVYVQQYHGGVSRFIGGSGTMLDAGESFAIAVDRSTNQVYVDHGSSISVYGEAGEPLPALEGAFTSSEGVALNESNGEAYVSNGGTGQVEAFAAFPLGSPPEVGPGEASNISQTASLLSAALKTRGLSTECYVVYGATEGYGSSTAKSLLSGQSHAFALKLTALRPGTTYHFAIVASSSVGTVVGPDRTFTTSPATPPGAATGGVVGVTQQTATLTGFVDPMGLATTYEFQYGPNATYGTQMFGAAGNGEGVEPVALALANLAPDSTYHYRLVAHNQDGTSYGADQTFTTPGYPNPLTAPAAAALLPTPTVASIEGKVVPPSPAHKVTHKAKRGKKPKKRAKRGEKKK